MSWGWIGRGIQIGETSPARMHARLRRGIFRGIVRNRTCSGRHRFAIPGTSFATNGALICLKMELPEGNIRPIECR